MKFKIDSKFYIKNLSTKQIDFFLVILILLYYLN